jgi:hypothetical protein
MDSGERKGPGGVCEGIARGLSQACVYSIETKKSIAQVAITHRDGLRIQPGKLVKHMLQSAVTSGVVFGTYFATYHHIGINNIFAGPVASFVTSLMKIPISNGMRLMQVNKADNLFTATKKIVRMQGLRGLYNGYTLSLIEDMIEFDMRTRMYAAMKSDDNLARNIGAGAIAGMVASYVTTPFDTIRANMSVHGTGAIPTIQRIYAADGVKGLYKGGGLRMCSNGMKYALFFMFFEILSDRVRRKDDQSPA